MGAPCSELTPELSLLIAADMTVVAPPTGNPYLN